MNKKNILNTLTIDEKANLIVGMNFWMTKNYPKYDVPSLFMSDGPNGLRKQSLDKSDHLGLNESITSVCYPTGSALASSWSRAIAEKIGDCLGLEASQMGVDILLGPAINIKRSPLCGRNFEYYSEDPYLSGQIAAAFVMGVQKNHVAACPKHYAANNQETRRKSIDVIIDERTLREIYLPAFEATIHEGKALCLMSSYNKVNGAYPAEHLHLTKDILRGEWGFNGSLITDWGAMDQIVPSIKAGLTLQMPGDDGSSAVKIINAVKKGELSEEDLNSAVSALLHTISHTRREEAIPRNLESYHVAAREIAEECMVLLKNEENILPLNPTLRLGVIGEMAISPRYQGSGSSHVNPYKLTNALEFILKECPSAIYAQGYENETVSQIHLDEALSVARHSEVVVIFTGLPAGYESEAYDRTNMSMPKDHIMLINEIAKINRNIIVVLSNGSAIELPWQPKVKGILEAYLCGEAAGRVISDILFGKVNPSGKLAETFIEKLEDNPSFLNFPGEQDCVEYREGIFIGYRYYEKKKIRPAFPFGHGLSYTIFNYSQLTLDKTQMIDNDTLNIRLKVKNTGKFPGKEVIQLYIASHDASTIRPIKELKGFTKIYLDIGEEKMVEFQLGKRAFAHFNITKNDWHVNSGIYTICIGSSSENIKLEGNVYVTCTEHLPKVLTRNTLLLDILSDDNLKNVFVPVLNELKPYLPFNLSNADLENDKLSAALLNNMTLNSLASYVGKYLNDDKLSNIIEQMNLILRRDTTVI